MKDPEIQSEADSQKFTPGTSTALLVIGVVFGFTLTAALTVIAIMTAPSGQPANDTLSKFILLIGTVAFIVPAFIWTRYTNKPVVSVFRMHSVSAATLVFTLLLALGLVIVTDAIDKLISPGINDFLDQTIGALSPELKSDKILERIAQEFKLNDVLSGFLLILAAVGAAGLCEEMLLRGMFQGALEKKMRAAGAIAISSFVFALIHFNPWGGIQIFILAVFLGLVAWRTQSIIPTVIMHGTNNLLAILFNNIAPENLAWYGDEKQIRWYMVVSGIALTVFGLAGIFNSKEGKAEWRINN